MGNGRSNLAIQNILSWSVSSARAHRHLFDTLLTLVSINSVLAGLSFVTTLVIANVLGREQFGDLAYAIAIGGYCGTIAYCGLERTLIRDLVQNPERFDEYASASIMLRGTMLALALVGILGVNFLASEDNRLGVGGVLIVFAMGINALYLAQIFDAWQKMKRHVVYHLTERCLYFAGVWTLVLLFRDSLSLPAIAIFMLASVALGLTLQYSWALPSIDVRLGRNALFLAVAMLKKNLWVWSAILATLSFGGLSKIMLKHLSGSGELGGYAVAWQVVLLGSLLMTQIGRIGNPRLARMVMPDVSQAHQLSFVLRYTALSTSAAALVGVPAILFPTVILGIFRPEYASAATSLRILGAYVIVVGIGQVATQYLVAVHKERAYAIVVALAGVLSLALFYFFIPRWSSTGASLAVLLSHGIAISVFLAIVLRHLRQGVKRHGPPQDVTTRALLNEGFLP